MRILVITFIIGTSAQAVWASPREGIVRENRNLSETSARTTPTLHLIGEVSDASEDHTTNHDHALRFKADSGDTYKIVDSPELVQLHHTSEKNFRVEVEAEKTGRFLFWGGNLVVKSFKVISETASVPHLPAPAPVRAREREPRGGRY